MQSSSNYKTSTPVAAAPPSKAAATPSKAVARAPTEATPRAATTPAGQRDSEILSLAEDFVQDDCTRASHCKSLYVISHLCYVYSKYFFYYYAYF